MNFACDAENSNHWFQLNLQLLIKIKNSYRLSTNMWSYNYMILLDTTIQRLYMLWSHPLFVHLYY